MGTRGKMTTGTRVGRAHGRGSNHTRHLTHRQSFLQQIRTGSSCRRHRLYLPPDGGPHQIFQQPMRRLQLLRWLQQLLALLLMLLLLLLLRPRRTSSTTTPRMPTTAHCSPTGRFPTRSHLATAMATEAWVRSWTRRSRRRRTTTRQACLPALSSRRPLRAPPAMTTSTSVPSATISSTSPCAALVGTTCAARASTRRSRWPCAVRSAVLRYPSHKATRQSTENCGRRCSRATQMW